MLQALKFCKGALAKSGDMLPALTHFRIVGRRVKAFNGQIAMCAPIGLDFDLSPNGLDLIKAVEACNETIALHVATNGKLVVKAGAFKAHINCDDPKNFPDIHPTGQFIKLTNPITQAFAMLETFVSENPDQLWANGILIDGSSAYATSNAILIQEWLGFNFPIKCNVPIAAVRELVKIGINPVKLQISETRLTFHYDDGSWLSTQLLTDKWPNIHEVLDRHLSVSRVATDDQFWQSLENLEPFCDRVRRCVHFLGNRMSTTAAVDLEGTSIEQHCPSAGVFNVEQFLKLRRIAVKASDIQIGFDAFPNPVPFFGGGTTRGVIVGLKI